MSRILVIDDDPLILEMLDSFLRRAGYEVLGAPNGVVALKIHKASPVDLLITDIIMPEKDGLETITEFRHHFPAVKVIAMSGGGRIGPDHYLKIAQKLGAEKILHKPFAFEVLLEAVREVLQGA